MIKLTGWIGGQITDGVLVAATCNKINPFKIMELLLTNGLEIKVTILILV